MNFKDELGTLKPQLVEGVGMLFTEREGGVSSGPWGGVDGIMGLNVGTRVGDNAGCVRMNRSIVSQLVPMEPKWMTQVHGTKVVCADDVADETVEADASYTTTPGTVCVVQTADCLPILIAEENARIVAAVHAGWRSLAAGIVENTIAEMKRVLGDENAVFKAWLGPRIGFDDFETDKDVCDAFMKRYPSCTEGVRPQGDKWHVDLAAFAQVALNNCGVADVQDCALSTVADPKRFYSYRRDGEKTGRHASLIWIEKK